MLPPLVGRVGPAGRGADAYGRATSADDDDTSEGQITVRRVHLVHEPGRATDADDLRSVGHGSVLRVERRPSVCAETSQTGMRANSERGEVDHAAAPSQAGGVARAGIDPARRRSPGCTRLASSLEPHGLMSLGQQDRLIVLLGALGTSYQAAHLPQAHSLELRGNLVRRVEVALEFDLVAEPAVRR